MKLRNYILAMAVAGVNVYLANDIRVQRNELSLLNLENIAEAGDRSVTVNGETYYYGTEGSYWQDMDAHIYAIGGGNYGGYVTIKCIKDMTPPITCTPGAESQRNLSSEEAKAIYNQYFNH